MQIAGRCGYASLTNLFTSVASSDNVLCSFLMLVSPEVASLPVSPNRTLTEPKIFSVTSACQQDFAAFFSAPLRCTRIAGTPHWFTSATSLKCLMKYCTSPIPSNVGVLNRSLAWISLSSLSSLIQFSFPRLLSPSPCPGAVVLILLLSPMLYL